MQSKEKSLHLANTSQQSSRDFPSPSETFINPFKYKGLRASSVPINTGIDLGTTPGSAQKVMNYEVMNQSNKRNEVQERYKKLLTSFHDLSAQDKLKVISPQKVTKVYNPLNPKLPSHKDMFAMPKTEVSKMEPGSIVFPNIESIPRAKTAKPTFNKPGKSNLTSPGRKTTEGTEPSSPRFHRDKETVHTQNVDNREENIVTLKQKSYIQNEQLKDKETVDFNIDKFLRGRNAESSRTSLDSDVIFNFKSRRLSSRQETIGDETIPKEGSLMRYFRGQKLKPKTNPTRKIIIYKMKPEMPERAQTSQTPGAMTDPTEIRDLSASVIRPKTSVHDSRHSSIPKQRDRFGTSCTSGFTGTQTRPSTQTGERLSTSFYKNSLYSVRFLDSSMMSENPPASVPKRTAFTPEVFERVHQNSVVESKTNNISPIIWEKNSDHKESNSEVNSRQPRNTPEPSVSSRLSTVRVTSRNNLMLPVERKQSITFKESDDEINYNENIQLNPQESEKMTEPQVYLSESAKRVESDGLIVHDLNNNSEEILNNLSQMMRTKMRELEEAMIQTAEVEGQFDPERAWIYKNSAIADIIDIRGGITQVKQENLEEKVVQEEMDGIKEELGKIEDKLESMKKEDEKNLQNLREKFEDALKVSPQHLSEIELEYIRAQFKRPELPKDITEKVDDIVCKLRFFTKIQRDIRLNVYKNAKYYKADPGEYIVKNGKYGDLMYIILRGCVDIRVMKTFPNGQAGEITISSLYDGQHFGDVSFETKKRKVAFDPKVHAVKNLSQIREELKKEDEAQMAKEKDRLGSINNRILDLKKEEEAKKSGVPVKKEEKEKDDEFIEDDDIEGENIKRFASIVTVEKSEFLTISREKFNDILVSVLQKDIDEKVNILRLMDFFKNEETENLTPLANNLGNLTFTMGQRIIKTGDCLNHLFIVARGRCRIIAEIVDKDLFYEPLFKKKVKPFKFQDYGGQEPNNTLDAMKITASEMEKVKQRKALLTERGGEDRTFNNERFFDLKDIDSHKFRRHIVFKEIGPGVYFGIKALRFLDDTEDENTLDPRRVSKLSIVAESPVVELYTLDRKSLIYLPDRIKNILLVGISNVNDHDEVDIEEGIKRHKSWHKFRNDLMKDVLSNTEKPGTTLPDHYKMY